MKIAICASFSFYTHVAQLEDDLLSLGHEPRIPESAKAMKQANSFAVDPFINTDGSMDIAQKSQAIRQHFDEIQQSDAILVVNDEKHGQANYIGPNVLMEMAVAFSLDKPVYILNDIPTESPYVDEIKGLQPIVLKGNVAALA